MDISTAKDEDTHYARPLDRHPQLDLATAECAEVVYELLRAEDRWNTVRDDFLEEFDEEIGKVTKGYTPKEEAEFLRGFDSDFKRLSL
jgi:hypothetical protein